MINNKKEKLVDTIIGLYNKINDIKKQQLYIKSFEKDMNDSLKNLFPNISKQLDEINEPDEWVIQILKCDSESEVLNVLERIDFCEQKSIQENVFQNYKEENKKTIGDEKKIILKQIELLKNRFDDIVVYMKDLENEIIKLEKKLIDNSLKNHDIYE